METTAVRDKGNGSRPEHRALMIYDGLCDFCDGTVHWIMKRDHHDQFRFTPQQSALAVSLLASFGVDGAAMLDTNSVYLILNYDGEVATRRLLSRSEVLATALVMLGGGWRVLGRIFRLVPKFLRDWGYSLMARSRYRIAKRYQSCPIPSPAERAKFVG